MPFKPGAQRYVILCAPRTGSSMLRTLLASHPQIMSHGELLTAPILDALLPEDPRASMIEAADQLRREAPVSFGQEMVFNPEGKKAVGSKILYDSVLHAPFVQVLSALQSDTQIKLIHLKQVNRLRRLVSLLAASRGHGVVNIWDGSGPPAVKPFSVSPEECLSDFEYVEGLEERFASIFSGHQTFDVSFEELIGNSDETLGAIQDFLGIDRHSLQPATTPVNPAPLSRILSNYAEISHFFVDTPYACLFEDYRF
jgi:LPS sulfotransferase NodH